MNGLTGGTGDVNPQYLSGMLEQVVPDQTIVKQFTLPKSIVPLAGKATVIEVLRVMAILRNPNRFDENDEHSQISFATFSTSNPGVAVQQGLQDGGVFAMFHQYVQGCSKDSGAYAFVIPHSICTWDCTDGAGHGVLIASDHFYVQLVSGGTLKQFLTFSIEYRFKAIDLAAYLLMRI